MSDAVEIALVVAGAVVVVVAMVLGYLSDAAKRREKNACTGDPWHDMDQGSFTPASDAPNPVKVAEAALGRTTLPEEPAEVEQPIPFDPENPPRWKVYAPGRTGPSVRRCHCHDEVLSPGDEVLWWPQPDSPAVFLFCKRAVPPVQA